MAQENQPSKQGSFRYPPSDHVEKPIRNLARKSTQFYNQIYKKKVKQLRTIWKTSPTKVLLLFISDQTENLDELMTLTLRACKELRRICGELDVSEKRREKIQEILMDSRNFAKRLKMTEAKKKFTEMYNALLPDED